MLFTSESGLVKVWVRMVQEGVYPREAIPALSNLREVVLSILDA